MDKLVSVVVTSYNHAAFLPQRMESLLTQTYPNIEIIVVDDYSTDGSRAYLDQYKTYPNVSLFFLDSNKGYVYASNFGVTKAKGEYVIFAECDDFSHPDQIAALCLSLNMNDNVGVAFSESNLVDENGETLGSDFQKRSKAFQNYCQRDMLIQGEVVQKFMLLTNLIPNMSAAMFKKSMFTRIGGLSEKYKLSADLDFWVRMADVCDFYYLKRPLNNFRDHPGSVRNHLGESVQLIEMIDIISHLKKKIKRTLKEKIELKIHLGNLWFYFAKREFRPFIKTFVPVLTNTFRKEPLLLFFLLLSFPVLSVKKIVKLLNT